MKIYIAILSPLLFAGLVQATTIANFDLGQSNSSGYALITTGSLSASQGGVTLTVTGSGLASRTRGGVSGATPAETDVAQDFLFNNGLITFTFTGLDLNRNYEIKTTAFDNTGGGAENGLWYVGSTAPSNFQYEWVNSSDSTSPFSLFGTSNGSGELQVFVDGEGGNNRANGFEVVLLPLAIPEPSSLTLLGLGGFLVLRRRR